MADNDTELDVSAQPVEGRVAVEAPRVAETPGPQPTGTTPPIKETKEPVQAPADSAVKPIREVEKPFFQDFKAGDTDPLVGVAIREVLAKPGDPPNEDRKMSFTIATYLTCYLLPQDGAEDLQLMSAAPQGISAAHADAQNRC